jgi:hypothetical protein
MGRAFLCFGMLAERGLAAKSGFIDILAPGSRGAVGMLRLRNEIASRCHSSAQHDKHGGGSGRRG